jgi:hypothetical protein
MDGLDDNMRLSYFPSNMRGSRSSVYLFIFSFEFARLKMVP